MSALEDAIARVNAADTITVLRTLGPLATKRITPTEIHGYDRAARFRLYRFRVASLNDLYAILRQLAPEPQAFIIRGEPIEDNEDGTIIFRRSRDDREPTFRLASPGPRWMMTDYDRHPVGFAVSSPPTVAELERVADSARKSLPPPFCEAACVYQFSSRAGLEPKDAPGWKDCSGWRFAKVHLWFWLSRPVACAQLRTWAKSAGLDETIYNAVQPHYTATPIFEDVEDPFPGMRLGVLAGSAEVVPPEDWVDAEEWEIREAIREADAERARIAARARAQLAGVPRDLCAPQLARACATLRAAASKQRHKTLIRVARNLAGYVAAGVLMREDVETELLAVWAEVKPGQEDEGRKAIKYSLEAGGAGRTT